MYKSKVMFKHLCQQTCVATAFDDSGKCFAFPRCHDMQRHRRG